MTIRIRTVLVPLDGSKLAEAVLPAARQLALRLDAEIALLHILERGATSTVHGDRHLMAQPEAEAYLEGIAAGLREAGAQVTYHVHEAREGNVARSVVFHADEFDADMVLLCAHGGGGLRNFLYGRIAQQVLRRGVRPVMMVNPSLDGTTPEFDPRLILVPLDGEPEHEVALEAALPLARAFGARVHLLVVVATLSTLKRQRAASGQLLPSTMRAILDLSEHDVSRYLERLSGAPSCAGVEVTGEVLRGDAADVVLEHANRIGADLIVMASHARAGLDAMLSGSVGSKVATRAGQPLLLLRATDRREADRPA